jgi:hypothetical protein
MNDKVGKDLKGSGHGLTEHESESRALLLCQPNQPLFTDHPTICHYTACATGSAPI